MLLWPLNVSQNINNYFIVLYTNKKKIITTHILSLVIILLLFAHSVIQFILEYKRRVQRDTSELKKRKPDFISHGERLINTIVVRPASQLLPMKMCQVVELLMTEKRLRKPNGRL